MRTFYSQVRNMLSQVNGHSLHLTVSYMKGAPWLPLYWSHTTATEQPTKNQELEALIHLQSLQLLETNEKGRQLILSPLLTVIIIIISDNV